MKETNPLETELRSWRPRRPSARLKYRLFGFSFGRGAGWVIGSLAPAAICILMTVGIFNSHNGVAYVRAPELVASNLSSAAFTLDDFANKQNHWVSVTFDSTNRNGLGSTTDSFRH